MADKDENDPVRGLFPDAFTPAKPKRGKPERVIPEEGQRHRGLVLYIAHTEDRDGGEDTLLRFEALALLRSGVAFSHEQIEFLRGLVAGAVRWAQFAQNDLAVARLRAIRGLHHNAYVQGRKGNVTV